MDSWRDNSIHPPASLAVAGTQLVSSSTFQFPSKKPDPPLRRPTKAGTATSLTDSKGTFPSPPSSSTDVFAPTASGYPVSTGKAAIRRTMLGNSRRVG